MTSPTNFPDPTAHPQPADVQPAPVQPLPTAQSAFPAAGLPVPVSSPASAPRGWWRRNVWGLLTMVPLFGVAAGLAFVDPVYRFWEQQPVQPVTASADGWVQLDDVKVRLAEVKAVAPVDSRGRALAMPPGTLAWRAELEFKLADPKAAQGCEIRLVDDSGRLFGTMPQELSRARESTGLPCAPPDGDEDKGLLEYRSTAYFVLPTAAEPVNIKIAWVTRNPRYVLLSR
jgi:hypothetical protein